MLNRKTNTMSKLKRMIKEEIAKLKTFNKNEQNDIEQIVEDWLDENIGLDVAHFRMENEGNKITIGLSSKNPTKITNGKEMAEELVDILKRKGYDGYLFGNSSTKNFFIERL